MKPFSYSYCILTVFSIRAFSAMLTCALLCLPGVSFADLVMGDGSGTPSSSSWFAGDTPFDDRAVAIGDSRLLERIERLFATQNWDEAVDLVEADVSPYSKPALVVRAAQVYTQVGKYEKAARYWRVLNAAYPKDPWLLACWGGALLRADERSQGRDLIERAFRMNRRDLVVRYNMALCRIQDGAYAGAVILLRPETIEEVGRVLTWISEEYRMLGRLLGADGRMQLVQIVLTGSRGALADGILAEQVGRKTDLQRFARALYRADQAQRIGNWTDAEGVLSQLAEEGVVAPVIGRAIAYSQFQKGDADGAEKTLQKWLSETPDDPGLQSGLGVLYLELGRYKEAEDLLADALEAEPGSDLLRFHLACALAQQGSLDAAKRLLKPLYEAQPEVINKRLKEEKSYYHVIRTSSEFGFLSSPKD
jgi:predicted Zn-dependent protease